jgi:prephenate dehydrogenase
MSSTEQINATRSLELEARSNISGLKIGMVGSGAFANVAAKNLMPAFSELDVFDPHPNANTPEGATRVDTLDEAIEEKDLVFLAIPVQSYDTVLDRFSQIAGKDTGIIDMASVGSYPFRLLNEKELTERPFAITHALWGPKALRDDPNLEGRNIIISEYKEGKFDVIDSLYSFWRENQGLKLVEMSSDHHDYLMREHALAFFIGQTFVAMGIEIGDDPATPFIENIHTIRSEMMDHSKGLFDTIEEYNPFAAEIRLRFLLAALKINEQIEVDPDIITAGDNPYDQLADLRTLIDMTDEIIAAAVANRYVLTDSTGLIKAKHGIPMKDETREHAILAKASRYSGAYDISPSVFKQISSVIMSDVVERNSRIVVPGDKEFSATMEQLTTKTG